jgi:transcriptional regulator NrdR family protein
MVVKRDNRREPFNRDKMREGVQRACQKRPISPAMIEKLVAEVEYSLQDFVLEVPSVEIGQRIVETSLRHGRRGVRAICVGVSFVRQTWTTFMSELNRLKSKDP